MRFKQFLKSQNNNVDIFESTFEKFYSKGYFGTIEKTIIREQQLDWFDKFLLIIEEGDKSTLLSLLSSRDHCCTRDWFSSIYKVDVRGLGKKEIIEELNKIYGSK